MSTATSTSTAAGNGPLDPVGADLSKALRALKLGGLKDTLPERLALARQRKMGHAAFLELLLGDEVTRRESRSAMLRARTAGLDAGMRIDTWDGPDDPSYHRTLRAGYKPSHLARSPGAETQPIMCGGSARERGSECGTAATTCP